MFSTIVNKVKAEPVAAGVIARAIVPLATMVGLDITVDQLAAIIVAVEVILGIIVRANVTPVVPTVAKEGA